MHRLASRSPKYLTAKEEREYEGELTSPAGQAIPPQPGPASTASLIEITKDGGEPERSGFVDEEAVLEPVGKDRETISLCTECG